MFQRGLVLSANQIACYMSSVVIGHDDVRVREEPYCIGAVSMVGIKIGLITLVNTDVFREKRQLKSSIQCQQVFQLDAESKKSIRGFEELLKTSQNCCAWYSLYLKLRLKQVAHLLADI